MFKAKLVNKKSTQNFVSVKQHNQLKQTRDEEQRHEEAISDRQKHSGHGFSIAELDVELIKSVNTLILLMTLFFGPAGVPAPALIEPYRQPGADPPHRSHQSQHEYPNKTTQCEPTAVQLVPHWSQLVVVSDHAHKRDF